MSPSIAFHCESTLNISAQIAWYFSQLCFLLLYIYLIIKAKVFIYPSKFTGPSLCHMWVVGLYKEEGVTKGFPTEEGAEISLQEKLSPDSKSLGEYLKSFGHFYYSSLAVSSAFSLLFVFVCDPYWIHTWGALGTVLGHF